MRAAVQTTLRLERGDYRSRIGQVGSLFAPSGEFLCHICEDPSRPVKIYGETAIPAGVYQIEANTEQGRAFKYGARWNWHRREIWHLLDVPNYRYIQVHPGNIPADTLGCLLPGQWDGRGARVKASVVAYKRLYRRYADRVRAGAVSIEIVE